MNKLSCAIIEDDPFSMALIQGLAEKAKVLEIKASFSSSEEAIPWFMENEVDLLFLDMELPGIPGLDFLRSLRKKPDVIVISGNPSYAVDAFEYAVVDYLLKPVKDIARFLTAVNKAMASHQERNSIPANNNLFVRMDSLLLNLNIDDVLWIEAFGDYVKIKTPEKEYTIYSTLKKIEERIPQNKFVRVHRSFIVNITKITNIDPNNLEINKRVIPVSATYKDVLLSKIRVL